MQEIIDFHYRNCGKDNFINKRHTHPTHYEILHICAGTGVIMVNNHLFPLQKDTLVLINGLDIHCSIPDVIDTYIRSKLVISSSFIDNIFILADAVNIIQKFFLDDSETCIHLTPLQTNLINVEMHNIQDCINRDDPLKKANITLSVFKILMIVHESYSQNIPPLRNSVSDILRYLNNHIHRKITLDELSEKFCISKSYLCHSFKEVTAMTIFEYILSKRIAIAKRKLIYTDESLGDIALSTGFCSFSYFSMIFKKFEGISPREFRNTRCNPPIDTNHLQI